jgi:hypothetical protein
MFLADEVDLMENQRSIASPIWFALLKGYVTCICAMELEEARVRVPLRHSVGVMCEARGKMLALLFRDFK